MQRNSRLAGHAAAFVTIVVWGTTYIATKVLLNHFSPVEIMFYRLAVAYAALWIAYPRLLKPNDRKRELYFAAAGLCGITLYFLFQNFAISLTLASVVGIIVSAAPFFTALSDWLFLGGERPGVRFFLGFAAAMTGIALISLQGTEALSVDPIGALLALLAAVVWAAYSTIMKKIASYDCPTVAVTRRTFFYGLVFLIPFLFFTGFRFGFERFSDPALTGNLLFLGLGASALCFVVWNFAFKVLGPVRTNVYIYMVPVVTVVTSAVILSEPVTPVIVAGILLTVVGLALSESKGFKKKTES